MQNHRAARAGARAGLRRDDGAAAVEFALIVPILVLLVFGIIAFGIVFAQNLSLNNAAREAARASVVRQIDGSPARTCWEALSRTRAAAVAIGLDPAKVGVTVSLSGTTVCSVAAGSPLPASANTAALAKPPCTGSVSGGADQLSVAATFDSRLAIPLWGSPSVTVTGTGVFRCEYS